MILHHSACTFKVKRPHCDSFHNSACTFKVKRPHCDSFHNSACTFKVKRPHCDSFHNSACTFKVKRPHCDSFHNSACTFKVKRPHCDSFHDCKTTTVSLFGCLLYFRDQIETQAFLHMRYDRTDCALMCSTENHPPGQDTSRYGDFRASFQDRY